MNHAVRRTGRLPLVVAGLSLIYGVAGLAWLFGAGGFAFGAVPPDGDKLSLLSWLPEQLVAGLVALLGFLGVPAALGHTRVEWSPASYRPLLAFTGLQALVFGVMAPDIGVTLVAGYLLVLLGLPVGVIWLLVGAWRQPTTRVLLLAIALCLVAIQLVTGVLDWRAFEHLATGIASIPGKVGTRPLFLVGALVLGACWAVLGIRGLRSYRGKCARCGRPGARWTEPQSARRWGFWATLIAVLCPMPYAFLRMTWLLPNPIGFSAEELNAEPGIKLFGLGLGLIAFTAGVVTLGLIRPWGEVWPRWIPLLAGRPVPLKAAVIPGATAATLLLIASLSLPGQLIAQGGITASDILLTLLIPFPLWGASVGLATLAYYYRHRPPCPTCQVPAEPPRPVEADA